MLLADSLNADNVNNNRVSVEGLWLNTVEQKKSIGLG